MRKKRILFCSEATFLSTGYATYTREILNYLHNTGKYEIAELASYGERHDQRANNIPWKFFGVVPDANCSEEERTVYLENHTAQFGAAIFEHVCLAFQPDVVCDIRDFWMMDFEERSPFRPFYKWCIMPTVDAYPQARQWVATYQSSDACLTYSEWAGEVLKEQSGGKINYIGTASPSAHSAYKPMNKKEIKKSFGLDEDCRIIGTVMRNQRRKLYPDLLKTFRLFLNQVNDPSKYFLYCHTSYPDLGWDIPELIQENGLSSKVLITYVCNETKKPFVSFFNGPVAQSPFTGRHTGTICNVKNGLEYEDLAKIMNMFDIYVQYANCEGFGLPQVEAAACGVPIMSTDYSAMSSVIKNLEGIPVKPKALYKELETGCLRAVPDNELATQKLLEFFALDESKRIELGQRTRKLFEQIYTWEKAGSVWESYFDSFEIVPEHLTWKSQLRIRQPKPKPEKLPENISHSELAKWLISEVMCEPEKLNSYMQARLIRDLMYRQTTSTTGGMYTNESSAAFDGILARSHFDFNNAYDQMLSLCNLRNRWEQKRAEVFGL